MSELDNLRMELAAAHLLNEELAEENERLRVETATLKDKLEQKGIKPSKEGRWDVHYGGKMRDYQAQVMRAIMEEGPQLSPEILRELISPHFQPEAHKPDDFLIAVDRDPISGGFVFGLRKDMNSEPYSYAMDRRTVELMRDETELLRHMNEIARMLITKATDGVPSSATVDHVATKMMIKLAEAATGGPHARQRIEEYYVEDKPFPVNPKLGRGKGPPRDRGGPGEHPRSPLQRGGR